LKQEIQAKLLGAKPFTLSSSRFLEHIFRLVTDNCRITALKCSTLPREREREVSQNNMVTYSEQGEAQSWWQSRGKGCACHSARQSR